MMRKLWEVLISLKTVFGLFLVPIVICFVGALMLPYNLSFFSGIDDSTLFAWLADSTHPELTWWIYALMLSIALLAVSTIACTLDAFRGVTRRNAVYKLSPQVMHLGVLLVMMAHLLTAAFGIRHDVQIARGERITLGPNVEALATGISEELDEDGYPVNWSAELDLFVRGEKVGSGTLRPVVPVSAGGLRVFLKTYLEGDEESEPVVVVRVVRDPGVLWALFGGVFVTLGGAGFIWSRRH